MKAESSRLSPGATVARLSRPLLYSLLAALSLSACAGATAAPGAGAGAPSDPRPTLRSGYQNAGEAAWNMELVAHIPRPEGFFNAEDPGDFDFANTDMAFRDNFLFMGSYNGIQIFDISDPASPRLRSSLVCPGGQGDVSVHGNLLFMSVEENRGRVDCGTTGSRAGEAERFRGVRVFDISDLDTPRQVASVQTCRGSHTHTLVTDPDDAANVYIYVSGTGQSRLDSELAGCVGAHWRNDPTTAYWRIEVIRVPISAPQTAAIVNMPRIFADAQTGAIGGLWDGGPVRAGGQESEQTNQCHDITAFPEIGLAAGACAGNGILLDISDPANPVRVEETTDPNFAYWHSATFNRDGTKVIFTDEWGGGTEARCRSADPRNWGANAIFNVVGRELQLQGYYKLPAVQGPDENCVAHNGSLVPVAGRDIMVQAWYQGGISVFDFTDSANPREIAYFDRGPIERDELVLAGYWSAYWYNGYIYASEIARGLDVFRLMPSESLSAAEISAAERVRLDQFNAQLQPGVNAGR